MTATQIGPKRPRPQTGPKKLRASAPDAPLPSEAPPFHMSPKKIAMVALDWCRGYEEDQYHRADYDQPGFFPLFQRIAETCDQQGCDTILYAMFSHSEHEHPALKKQELFGPQPEHLQWVILETSKDEARLDNLTQVWARSHEKPHTLIQRLARGQDAKGKRALMADLQGRIFGSTMLPLCGEIGIINTQRDSDEIVDVHHFLDVLDEEGIEVILNPGHTFVRRYEVPIKRAELSKGKRWLLSVWNRGWHEKGPQGQTPWQVFYDGHEVPERVIEPPHDLGPDVRIGLVELSPAVRS